MKSGRNTHGAPDLFACRLSVVGLSMMLALGLGGCDRSVPGKDSTAAPTVGTTDGARGKPTQVAARVNGQELTVHQINERLATPGFGAVVQQASDSPAGSPEARTLDHLIDLTLIGQEAAAQGLEKDPGVLRQLQSAQQDVIARAWAQRLGEEVSPVEAPEVRRYYDEHPMWFAQRRVYHLQELRSDAPDTEHDSLLRAMSRMRHADEAGNLLARSGHHWSVVATHLGSEQLAPQVVEQLSRMQPGQTLHLREGPGLRVWWLQASLEQPISWSQAQPVIERALNGQRRAERARRELQRLREQAHIEYLGDFERPAAAPAQPSAPSPASPPRTSTGPSAQPSTASVSSFKEPPR